MTLSNNQIIWTTGTTSNCVLSSNSLTIRQPFTFSNANVIFTCNVGIGTTNPQEQIDLTGAIRTPQYLQTDEGNYIGSGWKFVPSLGAFSNYTTRGGYVIRHGGSNQNFQLYTGSNTFTQQLTVLANGSVGIGTNAPTTRLTVAGDVLSSNANILGTITARGMTVSNNSTLEFGFGVSGKEANAGKIGYGAFTTGLDIVGAGTTGTNRVVRVFDILTTTTVNATNINEDGTAISTRYAPSNQSA